MTGDEISGRYAIAVGEDDVIGAARRHCAIADGGGAKALVFVPHMMDGKAGVPAAIIDDGAGSLRRAVVGHQQFEVLAALRAIAG